MRNRKSVLWILALAVLAMPAGWAIAQAEEYTEAIIEEAPASEADEFTEAPTEEAVESTDANAPAQGAATSQPTRPKTFFDQYGLYVMLGGVVLMYVWMGRGRRKKEGQRRNMLSELKKGDKISTIGGIVGTVIEVRDDEVTVKVDETNNIRMKFLRRAIHGVGDEQQERK